jgi:KaiC/GvpD/RAD55 family RecA-like ATPase
MNKRGFWKGLFGRRKKEEAIKTTKKDTSIKPKITNKKTIPNEIKVEKFDPKLQKIVYIEEMKIAKKIASEFTKNYKEAPQKLIEDSENPLKVIRGKKVKNLKPEEKIDLVKKPKKGDALSSGGEEVIKFNVAGFNDLMRQAGVPVGSSILVEGGPGSGKTIFCLHLADDMCSRGKKVLYMSFEEPEDRLVAHMESFGFPAGKYVKDGTLIIMRFNALDIARSVEALLSEAKKELLIEVQPILIPQDINPDLVLVDSLTSIASAFSGEESRFRIYMEQLFRYLEEHKMTSFLIREVPNPGHVGKTVTMADEATSFLSDGIIIFYNVIFSTGNRTRAMEILKLRGQQFERKIVEVEIKDKEGMKIYANKPLRGKYELT